MDGIIGAIISGIFALIGVVVSNVLSARKQDAKMQTAQAVTDAKIEELTREVREHNNFARRMPVVENEIRHIEGTIAKLESYHS
jgi:uncharacterized membrane protein YecN with MAPEG domain